MEQTASRYLCAAIHGVTMNVRTISEEDVLGSHSALPHKTKNGLSSGRVEGPPTQDSLGYKSSLGCFGCTSPNFEQLDVEIS